MLSCVVLTACGGTVAGSAESDGRWDPCSIPEEAIAASGLDPSYKYEGWGDELSVPEWSRCVFKGQPDLSYLLTLMSADEHTVTEARANPSNVDGLDLRLADRDAFRYKIEHFRGITDCNLAVDAPAGVVIFTVDSMGTMEIGADPCDLVLRHATDLEDYLPDFGR